MRKPEHPIEYMFISIIILCAGIFISSVLNIVLWIVQRI